MGGLNTTSTRDYTPTSLRRLRPSTHTTSRRARRRRVFGLRPVVFAAIVGVVSAILTAGIVGGAMGAQLSRYKAKSDAGVRAYRVYCRVRPDLRRIVWGQD